jgi:hypothetical protein
MIQRMGAGERRARLGLRHRLAAPALATGPAEVARSLVAVHSTDPSSVYLALQARRASPASVVPRRARPQAVRPERQRRPGPVVGGRIAGGWAQDRDGQIVCRFLEDAGAEAVAAGDAAAERLAATLGPVRLTARTRGMTWLEQELAG